MGEFQKIDIITLMHKFQFTLVLATLVLVVSALLFGWVYFDSLNNKYLSLLSAQPGSADETKVKLTEAEQRIKNLESQVKALQDYQPLLTQQPDSSTTQQNIESPDLKDIYIDSKCFEDPEQLDQCLILSQAELKDKILLLIKPTAPIINGLNELVAEFYDGETKFLDYKFSTLNLLKTDEPILKTVFINKNDITLQFNQGEENKNTIVNYDGIGWISYVTQ